MWRTKQRGSVSGKKIVALTTLFFIITTFSSVIYINNGIKPVLLDIAETRNMQYANMAMGIAVSKKLNEDLELDELIQFQYDQEGRVVSYQINTALENRIQRNIQYRVENFLHLLERGVIPDESDLLELELSETELDRVKQQSNLIEIPLGQVLGLPLLANLGPKIPVNLEVIGYVNTEVETLITGMKINSIHIEPVVNIEVEIRTIIPFGSKTAKIEQSIPVGSGGYSGDVPLYYNMSPQDGDMPLSIPLEPLQ
ncbi:sporulation protein YunB [Amphibacillus jilinensis]|uniref:sporulation protein YunB n=1 Tax=Amphibacillus jilinensis TaxID=1216008 RepID=UPI0002D7E8D5|nr:sporulation protein YunB [Amphibacillus jilinensis]